MLIVLVILAAVLMLVAAFAGGWGTGFGGPTVVRRTVVRRPARRIVEEPVAYRRVYEDDLR